LDRTLAGEPGLAGEAAERRSSKYSAFISYSRAADGKLAPALQRGLQRFAKPWYRLRALRLFRDDASLSANPNLWGSIEEALSDSGSFILLASPESAQSRWVGEEARWWLEHRGTDRLLIVLTDGELLWGEGGVDGQHTNALPEPLRGAFVEEPRYVDLRWARAEEHLRERDARFRNVLADLAAPLHGRSKDDMLGEDVRQHRRALTAAWAAGITVAALGVAAAVLAVLALAARNEAREQARVALSRALATQSGAELETRPQVSALLALESFRLVADDGPERAFDARNVMLGNLERSPRTSGVLNTGVSASHVALSPDGQKLAVSGVRGTVEVWDAARRVELGRLETGEIIAVTFLPGATTLGAVVSRESDYALTLWDVARKERIGKPRHVSSNLGAVGFSGDGETLATLDVDGKARLWSTRRRELLGHPLRVAGERSGDAVALSTDGRLLAVAGDGTIEIWDVAKRAREGAPLRGISLMYDIAFSPDGKRLATVELPDQGDAEAKLWDLARGRLVRGPLRGAPGVDQLAFSRDGRVLAAAGAAGVALWDGHRGRLLETLAGHAGAASDVAFGPEGVLASAGGDATVRLWDTRRAEPLGRRLPVQSAELTYAAFGPDGRTLAAVDFDGRLTLRDLTRATDPLRFRGNFATAAISAGGDLLAGGGEDGIVRVWQLPRRRLVARLPVRQGANPDFSTFEPERVPAWDKGLDPVWALAFSPDGKVLAAAGRAGSLVYWDTATWRKQGGPLDGGGAPGALAFSADDALLAGARDVVKVWDVTGDDTSPTSLRFGGDPLSRASVAFSSDGSTLAAAGSRGIRLWRIPGWESLGRPLERGALGVRRVVFSADGATLAAAGDALRLWDPLRQQELGQPLGTGDSDTFFEGLAIGEDGRTLLTAAGDGTVVRWDPILLSRGYAAWQERLCVLAGRNLTPAEWAQYVPGQPYHRTCPAFP